MTHIYLESYGSGQTIVMVHGWAMHSGIWRDFARQLASKFRVVCVDLPGHGRSGALDSFTLERIGNALVDAVPEPSACWLGWSLGASVVLAIADRFPERVASLILMAGNPCFVQNGPWPGMAPHLLDQFSGFLHQDCHATLLRFLSLQVKGLDDQKGCLKALKAAVSECAEPDAATLQGGLEILKDADLRPALANLSVPAAAILGGLDTLVPKAAGSAMQTLLPGLELNLIERAGHVPFLSHGPETRTLITRFMEQTCI